MTLQQEWQKCREELQEFLDRYFAEDQRLLAESMQYTLKQGKKFRPFLTYATSKIFSDGGRQSLAYALAVEMVHAFSLVHDDLPALDNDDYRRGIKTNHKVYGEDVAILAGDALLNEAFLLITAYYQENPRLCLELIKTLSLAVGRDGMIEGQILDLKAQKNEVNITSLKQVHLLKTACLIEASVVGAAQIMQANDAQIQTLKDYSKNLGLAFQIADDLLEDHHEIGSYVHILGREEAKKELDRVSDLAVKALEGFENTDLLLALVKENQNRKK